MTERSEKTTVSVEDIHSAQKRIRTLVLRTPVVESEMLSGILGCNLSFKCENLQHVGAFKSRGACNAVFSLSESVAKKGVVTHSSGNHAAALARAATIRGVPAHVVMPRDSRQNKLEAVRAFGIDPALCEPDAESRKAAADDIRKQTGATLIHPYDNPSIIAGQGTVGLEILDQSPGADTVVVPVGGGGLLAGVLIAVKAHRPKIRVIAAEPVWADDAARSLRSGKIEMPTRYDTVADGLRTPLGALNFSVIREYLDEILLVDEESIELATRTIARSTNMIAEPSGAVTLAAMMQHKKRFTGRNVVAIVSGGNLDFDQFDLRGSI